MQQLATINTYYKFQNSVRFTYYTKLISLYVYFNKRSFVIMFFNTKLVYVAIAISIHITLIINYIDYIDYKND